MKKIGQRARAVVVARRAAPDCSVPGARPAHALLHSSRTSDFTLRSASHRAGERTVFVGSLACATPPACRFGHDPRT